MRGKRHEDRETTYKSETKKQDEMKGLRKGEDGNNLQQSSSLVRNNYR